jgi:hypothetical protein
VLVRPAYTSDGSGIRLLAIAASSDSGVSSAATLAALLGATGSGPTTDAPRRALNDAERQAEAQRLYDVMRAALRQSDWLRFGAAFDNLGRTLDRVP